MRSILVVIHCDVCEAEIEEDVEGASSILFTVRGEKRELDLCDECIGGTFLQEARPVKGKRKPEKPLVCPECNRFFETQRGLSQHLAKSHK